MVCLGSCLVGLLPTGKGFWCGLGRSKGVEIDREMITNWISEILGEADIDVDDNIHSVSNWDSLNHINIILGIQERTGYLFSPDEIGRATSIDNIYQIISNSENGV